MPGMAELGLKEAKQVSSWVLGPNRAKSAKYSIESGKTHRFDMSYIDPYGLQVYMYLHTMSCTCVYLP